MFLFNGKAGESMRYFDINKVIFPQDFKYIEVVRKGKPEHQKYDSFYLKHPPMDLSKRAKIFSPFDALKGFNEAVASKEIQYEERKELNDEDKRILDITLNTLYNLTINSRLAIENNITAEVTYFVQCTDIENDAYMLKGRYITTKGTVKKVDPTINKTIKIDDTEIQIADIIKIDCSDIKGTNESI